MSRPRDSRPPRSDECALPIAVTMGDPAGIGLDITLLSWLARTRARLPAFLFYGDADALHRRARRLGLEVPIASVAAAREATDAFPTALPVRAVSPRPHAPSATDPQSASDPQSATDPLSASARDSDILVAAIEDATAATLAGETLALVTNPATKRALAGPGLAYPGHTEFLAALASRDRGGSFRPVMLLAAAELKVVPATVHIPIAAVPARLTTALLVATMRTTAAALAGDFGIPRPRLAVCGLNPHAGEDGLIGREEVAIIRPAIAEVAAEGVAVSGPLPADTLFGDEARRGYDVAIAMYHDQALIPIKTLAFDRAVNVTLGLPFVRTSPDHGTAFALAGTGRANPGSFIAALRLAAELGLRRRERAAAARR
jgi:4-hydroxythreonine-4-phosphate dehydrogenase